MHRVAERRTLNAKGSHLLEMLKKLEGLVAVLCAKPLDAQVELADRMLQHDVVSRRMNTLAAKRNTASVREVMARGSLPGPEVAHDERYGDDTTSSRRASRMEVH